MFKLPYNHTHYTLARLCSNFFKLGLSSMWTENFQITSVVSKRQRNKRTHCQHSLDGGESNRVPGKHLLFLSLMTVKPLAVWITTNCGKFLKRREYQTTFPVSWETCVQVKKQQLELDMEQWTGSKLGREYIKSVHCHPAYSIAYIIWNVLDEAQAGIKMAGRNINNLRYADDTTLIAESEEELKSLLMKLKEQSEKAGLKLSIRKTKIMASSPNTSWQIDAETMETMKDFTFLGSKITANGDYSHKIKRCLFLGRKAMRNQENALKSRDITLTAKVGIVKVMVFPVAMYGCEIWTIKKAEHWRVDAFYCGVGEDSWEFLDHKEITSVNSKGNQPWIFIERMDAEAEAPVFWSPDVMLWLIRKDPDAGKDWRQEKKGTTRGRPRRRG